MVKNWSVRVQWLSERVAVPPLNTIITARRSWLVGNTGKKSQQGLSLRNMFILLTRKNDNEKTDRKPKATLFFVVISHNTIFTWQYFYFILSIKLNCRFVYFKNKTQIPSAVNLHTSGWPFFVTVVFLRMNVAFLLNLALKGIKQMSRF